PPGRRAAPQPANPRPARLHRAGQDDPLHLGSWRRNRYAARLTVGRRKGRRRRCLAAWRRGESSGRKLVVELKSAGELEAVRAGGKVAGAALAAARGRAAVGVRLTQLDEVARAVLADAGATSPFLGYQPSFAHSPFPAVICTSVNDAALHGIPGTY